VRTAAAAQVAAMLLGSATAAALLALSARLASPLPGAAVGAICAAAALALLGESRLRLPGSHWMVPRSWARFGYSGYAALFGLALGAGFVTLLPSAGWYGVIAVAQSGSPWWTAFAVLLPFGAARAAMTPVLTARSVRSGEHPVARIPALAAMSRRLAPAEMLLLGALAVEVMIR
jgi:hypothetical protein